jgi:hypothetical protein
LSEISMSGYDVYSKVADNVTKAFIAELIGTAVTYWLAGAWRLGGIVLFGIFVVFTLQECFQVAVILFPGDTTHGSADDNEFSLWWRRAKYVRLVSLLISVGLLWFLYRRLW